MIYFFEQKKDKSFKIEEEKIINIKQENLIKNLNYKIELNDNSIYEINSKIGEIVNVDNSEIIKMQYVAANYTDKDYNEILIFADRAEYNNLNNYTIFKDNIEIIYLDNKILSNQMVLNFEDKTLKLSKDVKYVGLNKNVYADRLDLDLITKKVDIYMNNSSKKVLITKN